MKIRLLMLSMLLGAAAQAKEPPEVTDDGLVRSVSTTKAGVYRLPVATFHQYQRVMLAPVSAAFKKGWKQRHPELTAAEREKLGADLARTYREELRKELVERGGFQLAKGPGRGRAARRSIHRQRRHHGAGGEQRATAENFRHLGRLDEDSR